MREFILIVQFFLWGIFVALWLKARTRCFAWSLECARWQKLYDELMSGSIVRESHLLKELTLERADADRLAVIVTQYIKIIEDTAVLMKDQNPPDIAAEREVLRLHHEKHSAPKT